jgi:hypothetical protein
MQSANVQGRCLCGDVQFEIPNKPRQIGMCHCSKCRRVSGAGSNAVVLVDRRNLTWLSGEDSRRAYQTNTGWMTTFCKRCGCPVPQLTPDLSRYWVPAGSLDPVVTLTVGLHIHVGSKAQWEEIGGGAPQFEEGLGVNPL